LTTAKPPEDSSNITPPVSSRGTPRRAARRPAPRKPRPPAGEELDAAILRFLRATPNQAVDLAPLAGDLGVDPVAMQLAVERLHARRMVVAPFVEPGRAGGAELTNVGLTWLIAREGGKPKDVPVAFQPAKGRVRAQDEAARLPRAQVYGVNR
jgi:histone H3/H4